jgi:hypothetical protein
VKRYLLDTNVISETNAARPNPQVVAWVSSRPPDALFLSATVVAELAAGVAGAPRGRRRDGLREWLRSLTDRTFRGRILPFATEAALVYGELIATAHAAGRPAALSDAQIAAVALEHGLTVATRNRRHFEPFGVAVVDPWAG